MSVAGPRASQECPICGATQPLSARTCSICGAVLPGERAPIVAQVPNEADEQPADRSRYDPTQGDDDLYAGDLSGRMWRLLLLGGIVLALAIGLAAGVVIGQMSDEDPADDGAVNVQVDDLTLNANETMLPSLTPGDSVSGSPTAPSTATPRAPSAILTQTAQSFRTLPTVTPLPPSATPTPTPGPCMQTAASDDTVLGMAMRCGHKDMTVIDLILELNDMDNPEELQLGQTLEIPWPTPTGGPPTEAPTETAAAGAGDTTAPMDSAADEANSAEDAATTREVTTNEFGTPDALAYYQNLEPTLRPGLAWHTVAAGDTIMGVAYQYDTSVETLSQINPEIPFRQCDYGLQYGGPNCSVMLIQGEQIRVPVPIPTSTPMPTPDGTLTPTPSPTATITAPYAIKPEHGAAFMADEIVTLRWGSTGTLSGDERYVVHVRDLEGYEQHIAFVTETSYQLPGGWQPGDGQRHTFEWTISVATVDDDMNIISEEHETELRRFSWESR